MNVIQGHHLIYADDKHPKQEEKVNVFKGEHMILTKISWCTQNRCSKGFIKALKLFIILNEGHAEEL